MTYAQAVAYLRSLAKLPRREYLARSSDCAWFLLRLQNLLNLLGNPEFGVPHYIHITGTSGKGSVCIILASIMRAAKRGPVGLLTSPSAMGTLDRAVVDGRPMTKSEFAKNVAILKKALIKYKKTSVYDTPSEFEILTALSLLHFARKKVRTAVIEVGLGGRYDSTNIIPSKDAAIITNIGTDHRELIGPTKRHIAIEKAGIIKPNTLVFTSETNPALLKIIKDECKKNNAPLNIVAPSRHNLKIISESLFGSSFRWQKNLYDIAAPGRHQIENAVLAITAARALGVSARAIKRGLTTARFPIRFEVISKRPLIILDGAHNPDKMKTTVETVRMLHATCYMLHAVHLIIGFSADKQIAVMLRQLAVLKPLSVAVTKFTKNKTRPSAYPAALSALARRYFPRAAIRSFNSPITALSWSRKKQQPGEAVLVTGSMFLAGELREKF